MLIRWGIISCSHWLEFVTETLLPRQAQLLWIQMLTAGVAKGFGWLTPVSPHWCYHPPLSLWTLQTVQNVLVIDFWIKTWKFLYDMWCLYNRYTPTELLKLFVSVWLCVWFLSSAVNKTLGEIISSTPPLVSTQMNSCKHTKWINKWPVGLKQHKIKVNLNVIWPWTEIMQDTWIWPYTVTKEMWRLTSA